MIRAYAAGYAMTAAQAVAFALATLFDGPCCGDVYYGL